jgi:hypothetical protein
LCDQEKHAQKILIALQRSFEAEPEHQEFNNTIELCNKESFSGTLLCEK